MLEIYADFVGGVEFIQAMVTNLSDETLYVYVWTSYDPPHTQLIDPWIGKMTLQPADPVDNAPSTVTFHPVPPGVYSGFVSFSNSEQTAQDVKAPPVTKRIYVTAPPPIGNPVGTHGHIVRARK